MMSRMSNPGGRWPPAVAIAAISAVVVLAGCSETLNGTANHSVNPATVSNIPTIALPSATESTTVPASSSSVAASATTHPVPSKPVRTATVTSGAHNYVIEVWAEVRNATCADHAYGQVATFLTQHPCRGMTRQLATTYVNGKAVGFAVTAIDIPGSDAQHLYDNADAFSKLENAEGTGSVNDLMREGYRLPSGPTAVPSPDAFRTLGEDAVVTFYDIWYLNGPTPTNDPALLQMAQEIFLQY